MFVEKCIFILKIKISIPYLISNLEYIEPDEHVLFAYFLMPVL
jgi:hypothetical protein